MSKDPDNHPYEHKDDTLRLAIVRASQDDTDVLTPTLEKLRNAARKGEAEMDEACKRASRISDMLPAVRPATG